MNDEAKKSLAFLRYAQSAEARAREPLGATLGEIDYLIDLIYCQPSYPVSLEELLGMEWPGAFPAEQGK